MTDGLLAALMTPPLSALKLARAALQDQVGSFFGRRPKLITAAGLPGELALMSTPDALPGMSGHHAAGLGVAQRGGGAGRPRIGLYRPGLHAASIACPLLVCICDDDSLVSVKAADKVAHAAPQGEVVHYPIGHFEIYSGEWFERAVSRQAEFLARHLAALRADLHVDALARVDAACRPWRCRRCCAG